jgi:hypothetical protein
MKYIVSILLLFATNFLEAQTWTLEKELLLKDSSFNWTSDEWGQLYQWKGNTIWLAQNQNETAFQESFKILGDLTTFQPMNGQRALIFSESQQMIGIIDNTLQVKDAFIALYEHNFSNVTHVATSYRPDFIWLFDQYRERLILFNINTAQTVQIVDNCFGGLKDVAPVQFFEFQQNLVCLLSDGRYFEFDRNLTLVKHFSLAPEYQLFEYQNELWIQKGVQLENLGPSLVAIHFDAPQPHFKQLQVLQDRFYFQEGQKIKVYRLNL